MSLEKKAFELAPTKRNLLLDKERGNPYARRGFGIIEGAIIYGIISVVGSATVAISDYMNTDEKEDNSGYDTDDEHDCYCGGGRD